MVPRCNGNGDECRRGLNFYARGAIIVLHFEAAISRNLDVGGAAISKASTNRRVPSLFTTIVLVNKSSEACQGLGSFST